MKAEIELLANLLDFPSKDSQKIVKNAHNFIKRSSSLHIEEKRRLFDFLSQYAYSDLSSWQQKYLSVFNTIAGASLYLYEHIYTTIDKRKQAMENLMAVYAQHDLEITSGELPDFLPVFLEFVSTLDREQEALSYLADIAPILTTIYNSLKSTDIGYSNILLVILSLASRGNAHPTFHTPSA